MSVHRNSHGQPIGPLIDSTPAKPPSPTTLTGRFVTLNPLQASDATSLFPYISGPTNDALFTYLPIGPYPSTSLSSFTSQITSYSTRTPSTLFFSISPHPGLPSSFLNTPTPPPSTPLSYISYLNISPGSQALEIGNILFTAPLQRTALGTEAIYLLLRHAFEDLGYKRVEWKCHSLNEKSVNAALRLGFSYEGTFRRHMVVKARRRDTWWASITVEDWWGWEERDDDDDRGVRNPSVRDRDSKKIKVPAIENESLSRKWALKQWLKKENFEDQTGRQKKRLEEYQDWKNLHLN
ncbi:putative gnat family acetyltransferase [Phaeomoniella chlamydospora]|uniref:Putative gnat family acetyltransferase n=1 Tax=Phaeomoniella chlamydospora TaxID=158046 RepID=A0A0G2EZV0_PHACM|nr:putative gnat family acetyltransferase [Phaeomoniella chlamydospora]